MPGILDILFVALGLPNALPPDLKIFDQKSLVMTLDLGPKTRYSGFKMQDATTTEMKFSAYREAWRTERHKNYVNGLPKNRTLDLRMQDAFRAECIRRLGWKPEDPNAGAGERYAASVGEMTQWLLEKEQNQDQ